MKALNTTLIAAIGLLSATLSATAFAADKSTAQTADRQAASAQAANTQDKVRAEFLRARQAGELEFGNQFQIEETVALKQDSKAGAVQLAAH